MENDEYEKIRLYLQSGSELIKADRTQIGRGCKGFFGQNSRMQILKQTCQLYFFCWRVFLFLYANYLVDYVRSLLFKILHIRNAEEWLIGKTPQIELYENKGTFYSPPSSSRSWCGYGGEIYT